MSLLHSLSPIPSETASAPSPDLLPPLEERIQRRKSQIRQQVRDLSTTGRKLSVLLRRMTWRHLRPHERQRMDRMLARVESDVRLARFMTQPQSALLRSKARVTSEVDCPTRTVSHPFD